MHTGLDALKTASKKIVYKTGGFLGHKIADAVTKSSKDKIVKLDEKPRNVEEIIIALENKDEILILCILSGGPLDLSRYVFVFSDLLNVCRQWHLSNFLILGDLTTHLFGLVLPCPTSGKIRVIIYNNWYTEIDTKK